MRNPTQAQGGTGLILICLMISGVSMAAIILISKSVAEAGAPMLWFLTVVMALAGVVQLGIAGVLGQLRGWRKLLPYSAGAGVFAALPSALAYLSVAHVGAGYVALTFAFPPLLTWVLARLLGMEGRSARRLLAVLLGLTGGVILATGKLEGLAGQGGAGWVLLASAIPFILALGNIYRTRYWPKGAGSVGLAALLLLLGAAMTLPFALAFEGSPAQLWQDGWVRLLLIADILLFVVQYIAYFILQKVGGPVILSLLGSVAAVTGASAAPILFGEALPRGFLLAGLLVAAAVVLMLWRGPLPFRTRRDPAASNCR
ncbi:DMT family transporter [uncultured Paracoccus sp.]|uniref:DMT family transporter n=1 Tax=uncultured Paracoccus sp. TaxID=189685 RepID=UPI0026147F7D|nr:DMT family transporter [uncultured Paracoccus sp.]